MAMDRCKDGDQVAARIVRRTATGPTQGSGAVCSGPSGGVSRRPNSFEGNGLGGAGDGNRTRVVSLEDWGSTIELRPRAAPPCSRLALRGVSLMPALLRFEIRPPT